MTLHVNGVTKSFSRSNQPKLVVNDNLSFHIGEGEIFGLLGQNGSGKTTLVQQILGLLTPDKGDIHLLGEPVLQSPTRTRSICSIQPQSQVPFGFLTPMQAVTLMGKIRAGKTFEPRRVDELFEALDMGEWANIEGDKLSGGAKRLTSFCMAAIVPGKLVILDEPTNDVDPVRRRYLWEMIRNLTNSGSCVLLVTHNVIEAEKAVDRVAIIHQGKFITQGTPSEVKRTVSQQLRMSINLAHNNLHIAIPDWALSSRRDGTQLTFSFAPKDVSITIDWAQEKVDKGHVIDYTLSPTTIEDAYIELTSNKAVRSQ